MGETAKNLSNELYALIKEKVENLSRPTPSIDSVLKSHSIANIPSSVSQVRCHYVCLDGNGRPNIPRLARLMSELVVDYCIPRSEIEKAAIEYSGKSTSKGFVELTKKANQLFTHIKNTGEGGELLLYILIETILGFPQLLCKMPLKTNPNVHYHGVDGIHFSVDEVAGKLHLYWGESKLHQTINSASSDCFKSIHGFLTSTGASKDPIERDLQLIRTNIDLNDENTKKALLTILDKDSTYFNSIEYRGACLVGFDFDAYPKLPNQKIDKDIEDAITKEVKKWQGQISKDLKANSPLESYVIEIFLLPFPSVADFRNAFLKEIGIS